MKYLQLLIFTLLVLGVHGQDGNCYCHQNDKAVTAEWIYFSDGRVLLYSQENKNCDDPFDKSAALKFAKETGTEIFYKREGGVVSFVLEITTKQLMSDELMAISNAFLYTGLFKKEGLEMEIIPNPTPSGNSVEPIRKYYSICKKMD